jgi:acetate kinase
MTFEALFESDNPNARRAREIIQYRILLACGAGIAAMGGLDAIVFSGRYAAVGDVLGPWLKSRLVLNKQEVHVEFFTQSVEQLVADISSAVALALDSQQAA